MTQCNTCGGTYQTTLADGSRYFHRCPPLSRVEVAQRIQSGALGYPPTTTAATFAAAPTPQGSPIAGAYLAAADAWLAVTTFQRKNLRDENIASVASDGTITIVAQGNGVTTVPDLAPLPTVA